MFTMFVLMALILITEGVAIAIVGLDASGGWYYLIAIDLIIFMLFLATKPWAGSALR